METHDSLIVVTNHQDIGLFLIDNYRSPQAVLETSRMVMIQNEDRLEVSLVDFAITKQLQARQKPVESRIERRSFGSRPEEYAWVAQNIREQIDDGTPPEEMGVIAPKHAQLVAIIPHLQAQGIPISYERRENIIDDPAIREVIVILGILQSLSDNRLQLANSLLPEAISFPFWGISPTTRIALALSAEKTGKSWLEAMLESQSELQSIAEFLLTAKDLLYTSPFELVLDVVLGSLPVEGAVLDRSPFRAYYFSAEREAGAGTRFYELLSHLRVLRDRVRQHYTSERTTVSHFLTFIDLFQKSGYRMSDNNPLLQAAKGVQLMTVHGAKGREFHDVYMVGLIESNWGPSAKGNSFRLSLPENLPIYPAGNTREDKIRLLYVALTRSKCNVFLTTHQRQDSGAPAEPLSILPDTDESLWEDQATLKPSTSPMALLETEWRSTYDVPNKPLKELLAPKLATYRLSPTHLKNFLDITRGGPHHFKTVNLLRFPEAKNFSSCFGSAVHHTLERAHLHRKEQGSPPTLAQLLSFFKQAIEHEQLTVDDLAKALLHAEQVLPVFYATEKDRLDTSDIVEQSFQKELGPIRLGGKIDKLHRTKQGNDAQWLLIDYKTGNPPPTGWESKGLSPGKKVGQHFYRQQLLFYKLLAENQLVRGERLRIHAAELRYIEPDRDSGELIQLAIADFPTDELDRLTLLVQAVWTHIQALNFPDTSSYRQDEKGIQAFEEDLLSGHI